MLNVDELKCQNQTGQEELVTWCHKLGFLGQETNFTNVNNNLLGLNQNVWNYSQSQLLIIPHMIITMKQDSDRFFKMMVIYQQV